MVNVPVVIALTKISGLRVAVSCRLKAIATFKDELAVFGEMHPLVIVLSPNAKSRVHFITDKCTNQHVPMMNSTVAKPFPFATGSDTVATRTDASYPISRNFPFPRGNPTRGYCFIVLTVEF